jgi:hypothetical protein
VLFRRLLHRRQQDTDPRFMAKSLISLRARLLRALQADRIANSSQEPPQATLRVGGSRQVPGLGWTACPDVGRNQLLSQRRPRRCR